MLGSFRGQAGFAGLWGQMVEWAVGKTKKLSTGEIGSPSLVVPGDLHLAVPCRAFLCVTWRREVARLPRAWLGPRWGWAVAS